MTQQTTTQLTLVSHFKEQLACIQVPSLSSPTFINLEHTMGAAFEAIVSKQLLTAGQVERQLAIE